MVDTTITTDEDFDATGNSDFSTVTIGGTDAVTFETSVKQEGTLSGIRNRDGIGMR